MTGERYANKRYTVVSVTFSFSLMVSLEITIGIATLCWVPQVFIKFQDRSSMNHQHLIICQFSQMKQRLFFTQFSSHDSKGKKAGFK